MAANDDVENIGVHNDDGDEAVGENAVGENAELLNNQIRMESAMLYEMNGLRCDICLSLPEPPLYHCTLAHCLCSKCHTKQGTIESCKQDVSLCKLTTFLLTRMNIICPNDKSHGCSTSQLIKDFTTHLQQCSHSPTQHPCCCPCCGHVCVDIETLKLHFETHEPTEVALHESNRLTLTQGHNGLLKLDSQIYLLLKFKGDAISLHHMWWDEPRYHEFHVSDLDRDWGFTVGKTSDICSNTIEQYLELPLLEEITVVLEIGASDAKAIAVLNLPDLAYHANLPDDADVKLLVCLLCQQIVTIPVNHCGFGHTMCLPCFRKKVKRQAETGVEMKDQLKCPYCEQKTMMCKLGSYILGTSKFHCPNRSVGCQNVMSVHEYETHVDECLKPFSCPMCAHGCEDVEYLRNHLAGHGEKRIEHMKPNKFVVCRGQRLIREEVTHDDFVLVFQENSLSLQHMPWGETQMYSLEFKDLGGKWSFQGRTVAVDKFPKIKEGCLKIPKTVLNTKSILPVPITLEIRHDGS